MVDASSPVDSASRLAARPVGAQRRARTPFARTTVSTAFTIVVLPTPGPPVMTVTRSRIAEATASR